MNNIKCEIKTNQLTPKEYLGSIWTFANKEETLTYFIFSSSSAGKYCLIGLDDGCRLYPGASHITDITKGTILVTLGAEIIIKEII